MVAASGGSRRPGNARDGPDGRSCVSRRPSRAGLIAAAVALAAFAAACGGGGEGSGPPTIKWYVFQEPSGAYNDAVASCNKQANGRYAIERVLWCVYSS